MLETFHHFSIGLNTGRPLMGIGKTKQGKVKKFKNREKPSSCGTESCNTTENVSCGGEVITEQIKNLNLAQEASDLF